MAPRTIINEAASTWNSPPRTQHFSPVEILRFHQSLPHYTPTPLVSLPSLASSLNIGHLLLKDESHRLSLPSFKILGASWSIHRTLTSRFSLPLSTPLADLGEAAQAARVQLVTCSDGNWGRAVARMAKLLGIRATVYVPQDIDAATQEKIRGEGARCDVSEGDYDRAIERARKTAEETDGAILVMDTSWEGFMDVPQWVTDGYSTMLYEADEQVAHLIGDEAAKPTLVIASVGVGSWAHAVVAHYKDSSIASKPQIATVEPHTAASFNASLHADQITTIATNYPTIMCGMNCGTTSAIAWLYLKHGVDVSLTVSDWEAHQAVLDLKSTKAIAVVKENETWNTSPYHIKPGPCGAAPLAALRKGLREGTLKLSEDAVVVLLCTEGERELVPPLIQIATPLEKGMF